MTKAYQKYQQVECMIRIVQPFEIISMSISRAVSFYFGHQLIAEEVADFAFSP